MKPKQREAFAQRVLMKRTELYPKMSQAEFCKIAGITRTTLRIVEDPGSKQNPSEQTIEGLARALRMTPEELKDEQRIEPDNKFLRDLTEEDLRIAQMFHHAGITVKQKTVGVLQERQPVHGQQKDLSADVTATARQLLALDAEQRYAAILLIELLERASGIDEAAIALAKRVQRLPDDARTEILDTLALHEQSLKKKEQPGPKPASLKVTKKS